MIEISDSIKSRLGSNKVGSHACEHDNPKHTITNDYTYYKSSMLNVIKELPSDFLDVMDVAPDLLDKYEVFIDSLSNTEKRFLHIMVNSLESE